MQWQPIGRHWYLISQVQRVRQVSLSMDRVCRAANNGTNFSMGIDVKSTGSCGGGCLRSRRFYFFFLSGGVACCLILVVFCSLRPCQFTRRPFNYF